MESVVVLTLKPQTSHATCIVHTDRHKNKYIPKLNFAGTNMQKGENMPQTPFADRKADVWTTKPSEVTDVILFHYTLCPGCREVEAACSLEARKYSICF